MEPKYVRALKKLADPEDECHQGIYGPWIDLAQEAIFGRVIQPEEWWNDDGTLPKNEFGITERPYTVDELLERIKYNE